MDPCPSELDRERYLAGSLSEETVVRLERHRHECQDCSTWFAAAQEDEDLLTPLRQAVSEDPVVVPEEVDAQGLDRYRILHRLGAGGMGMVYEAEQKKPRRRVALKVVRPGFASEALLRRFEIEAEILGRLEHPGIARIFDAGTFGNGEDRQPFFAMELVRGRPLHEYLEQDQPSLKERLGLFARIGDAVAHAHQKGVIHRDLKPANILVTDQGQPRILDFGVARATDGDLQQMTLETDEGKVVGTLPYMSPEQVAGDSSTVDLRSDVYSLGVLLYEMLVGTRPHDLKGRSMVEAARVIREQDPRRIGALRPELRGDLETIAHKALEKDAARRYGSAQELVADIQRFLAHEPISARPPTTTYQLARFAQRHRVLVAGVVGVILALTAGVLSTTAQWLEAQDARDTAQDETRKAKAVSDFLMKCLVQASPDQRLGGGATIEDVFAEAALRVDEDFADEPEVRAELHGTIGWTLLRMGSNEQSQVHLQKSLDLWTGLRGAESLEAAYPLASLGNLALNTGRREDARRYLREALDIRRRLEFENRWDFGTNCEHLAVAEYLHGNWDQAMALYREAVEHRRASAAEYPWDLGQTLTNLAWMLCREGRGLEEAEARAREAEAFLGQPENDHPDLLPYTLLALSTCLALQGNEVEAAPILWEAADLFAALGQATGEDGRGSFGMSLTAWEEFRLSVVEGEVEDPAQQALLQSYRSLLQVRAGRQDAARKVGESAELLLRSLATTEETLLDAARLLSRTWEDLGDPAWTEGLLLDLQEAAEKETGSGSLEWAQLRMIYGEHLLRQELFEDAEAALLDAHEALEQLLGADHSTTRQAAVGLVCVYEGLGDPEEAATYRTGEDHRP